MQAVMPNKLFDQKSPYSPNSIDDLVFELKKMGRKYIKKHPEPNIVHVHNNQKSATFLKDLNVELSPTEIANLCTQKQELLKEKKLYNQLKPVYQDLRFQSRFCYHLEKLLEKHPASARIQELVKWTAEMYKSLNQAIDAIADDLQSNHPHPRHIIFHDF